MLDLIGALGVGLLAACAFPQAIVSALTGTSRGISGTFLGMWFLGELLTLVYVLGLPAANWLLVVNYGANIAALLVVIWFFWFPRT